MQPATAMQPSQYNVGFVPRLTPPTHFSAVTTSRTTSVLVVLRCTLSRCTPTTESHRSLAETVGKPLSLFLKGHI